MVAPQAGTSANRRAQYGEGSTLKGRRTRSLLLAAARETFERDGYLEARVADIAKSAGVSHGTFYTYFTSKQDIFRAVVSVVRDEIYSAVAVPLSADNDGEGASGAWTVADYVRRVDLSNRHFIDAFRANRRMMLLFEQVATIDPEVGAYRVEGRRAHTERIAASIRRLQTRGLVDRELDARTAAAALASMVGNFAYHWLSMGEPFDDELAKSTLTRLWMAAIGVRETSA
jgi:AcrR family transcriptional regulator